VNTVTPLLRNRHPADELAELRAEIKTLQTREQELREMLIAADPAERIGMAYKATITTTMRTWYDLQALKERFGNALEPCRKSVTANVVKIHRRKPQKSVTGDPRA
jgi:hypothetical protein